MSESPETTSILICNKEQNFGSCNDMSSRRAALFAQCCFICVVAVSASVPDPLADTPAESQLPDLRFHVPFPAASIQSLDLESAGLSPADLRVKRMLTPEDESSCGTDQATAPTFPSIKASDRLVAVDGVYVSSLPFSEVIDLAVGSAVMLPLFKASANRAADGNILTGFARVEIVQPQSVEFQPTTAERVADIQRWQAAVVAQKQQELKREQKELERKVAAENDKLEAEARQRRENEDAYRLEMTPHEAVAVKRRDGREFRYEVVFTTSGPIGLNWDLLVEDKTVVSYVEPNLAAERVGVIAAKDQIIQVNDVDTSAMAPAQVVQVYVASTSPRRMVFRCGASAAVVAASSPHMELEKVQNWTIVFDSPPILRDWSTRLHLATWSLEPVALVNQTIALTAASPITGCQALSTSRSESSSYLAYRGGCSFVEKAQNTAPTNAKALIVVNNLNGFGRFPEKMPDVANVLIPVMMIGKLDGELVMSVLEYEGAVKFHIREEVPSELERLLSTEPPPKLTNAEMTLRRDPKKAARALSFWYVNSTSSTRAMAEFHVLPALFGKNVTATPYRVVMAYPQDTACHPQGLGVLATRSVILVRRGGCSFGVKAKSVQAVGAIGMVMINADESLLPLMGDPRETSEITIWAARYDEMNKP